MGARRGAEGIGMGLRKLSAAMIAHAYSNAKASAPITRANHARRRQ
jgi:hypothetical protein